jgi:hypothetical protein
MKKAKDMKKTLLKFTSSIYLLAFRKYAKASHWEVNLNELTILCNCSEKEARMACNDFNAVILNVEEVAGPYGLVNDLNVSKLTYQLSS